MAPMVHPFRPEAPGLSRSARLKDVSAGFDPGAPRILAPITHVVTAFLRSAPFGPRLCLSFLVGLVKQADKAYEPFGFALLGQFQKKQHLCIIRAFLYQREEDG